MILVPYSYNGTVINKDIGSSTDYDAYFLRSSAELQTATNPYYIKRAGAYPIYAGKDFLPYSTPLQITMQHDFQTLFESLNTLFDTKDETPRQFICVDTEDSNRQYYVYATAKQVVQDSAGGPNITVQLAYDDPIFQTVTQTTQNFLITSATDSTSVTTIGNDYSYPIFEITPTSQPSTDYLYNLWTQVLPSSTDPYPNRYLDIVGSTDTTWDTAALIAAGKMQASSDPGGAGGDIRVLRDGVMVDFWLDGINTTDTHVIVPTNMPGALNMTLKTAIASTDTITEVELKYTTDNKGKISASPTAGRLILDSSLGSTDTEEFTYTSKTVTATKLAFTINARSVRGTTAMSFAAGANVRILPYDFNIIYGNMTASAYVTDDTKKPIQALTSRNSSFTYTNFFDEAGTRPGIWSQKERTVSSAKNSRSDFYTSTNDEGDTDPATAMGMAGYTYEAGGVWRADSVTLAWLGYFPDLVASVGSVTGAQYQTVASRLNPKLAAGKNPNNFTVLWNVSAQASSDYSTFTAWTKASSDATIPANTRYLKWYAEGTQLGSTDQNSRVDMSGITVGLTNYPHVMLRSEAQNYKLDCRLTIGSDYIDVLLPMGLNETLYIDCNPDFPTATYKGLLVNGAVKTSAIRAYWLRLGPGANTVYFDSNLAATSNITIAIKWRDRANFL